ncbi:MAG TPA: hypothetical protein VE954_31445 [Oligoflexus sp.]|uniref:hypothetical protein n=1 Tax=Oligoflexus sp. TaxID=1971216 RepID=UPI002D363AB4|nr:hypothetical protein [Oligoflexus sp.]HYX37640.1 hypothetical protein [Oligoflexus sp.]
MLSPKLLPVSALVFAMVTACGSKDDNKNDETPAVRPEIPLNAPADILGSWKQCNKTAESKSSSAVYSFNTDGTLEYLTEAFNSSDCTGATLVSQAYKGSFVVGSGNALDISFPTGKPEDKKFDTQYRVFSVQGETLLISNNAVLGADPTQRDYDLNSNALKLIKFAE